MSAFLGEQGVAEGRRKGGLVRRQGGGDVKPFRMAGDVIYPPGAWRPLQPWLSTEKRSGTGGRGRMGIDTMTTRQGQFGGAPDVSNVEPLPIGPEKRRKGGAVKPGKHRLLIVMIGMRPKVDKLRKRGLVSDKAHARRKL